MDEVDSHKEVTILRLKTLIDDRTKLIIEAARESSENPQPKIVTHNIHIETQISDPNMPPPDDLPTDPFESELETQTNDMHEMDDLQDGEGDEEVDGDGEDELLKHKTRKLKMMNHNQRMKRVESIREKQKNIEAFKKHNNGRYTRLFRDHHPKYRGLNREHTVQQRKSVGPLGRMIRKFAH